MTMSEGEQAERRERQRELADRLKASGALDGIFEQIDASIQIDHRIQRLQGPPLPDQHLLGDLVG